MNGVEHIEPLQTSGLSMFPLPKSLPLVKFLLGCLLIPTFVCAIESHLYSLECCPPMFSWDDGTSRDLYLANGIFF